MRCIVDCREDCRLANNFLELNLWGKPCFAYVVEAVRNAGCFANIDVITESLRISEYCEKTYPDVDIIHNVKDGWMNGNVTIFRISGRAPCISQNTIKAAVESYDGGELRSSRLAQVFDFAENKVSFYKGTEQR